MASVVVLADDLMFLSRIREAARPASVEVRTARSAGDLVQALKREPAALVLADLDSQRLRPVEAVAALRAEAELADLPVVGFFSHVHAERSLEAQAAGFTRVLARSAFVKELPGMLERLAARGGGTVPR
jgi:CheY-like chemotaxis protein